MYENITNIPCGFFSEVFKIQILVCWLRITRQFQQLSLPSSQCLPRYSCVFQSHKWLVSQKVMSARCHSSQSEAKIFTPTLCFFIFDVIFWCNLFCFYFPPVLSKYSFWACVSSRLSSSTRKKEFEINLHNNSFWEDCSLMSKGYCQR